jgi:hypothetical protein
MVIWLVADKLITNFNKMIQTKEELFLAELGINTKEEIEADYGSRIKITDLLKKYRAEQLTIPVVVGPFVCRDCDKDTKEYRDQLCEPCHKWHTDS